jgi:hypothetical protein
VCTAGRSGVEVLVGAANWMGAPYLGGIQAWGAGCGDMLQPSKSAGNVARHGDVEKVAHRSVVPKQE